MNPAAGIDLTGEPIQDYNLVPDAGYQVLDSFSGAALAPVLYPLLTSLYLPPSRFYVSRESLRTGAAIELLSKRLPIPLAMLLVRYLKQLDAVDFCRQWEGHGYEIFTNRTGARVPDTAYLHVDSDEIRRAEHNELRMPLMGSVFHLGPSEGLDGGETLFFPVGSPSASSENLFRRHSWDSLAASPDADFVTQRAGRLILFDGRRAHAVAPVRNHSEAQPRVSLLANLWNEPVLISQNESPLAIAR